MPGVSIITVCSSDGSTSHVYADGGTLCIKTGPAPIMVTVQLINLKSRTIKTTFREWYAVRPGAKPLPHKIYMIPITKKKWQLHFGNTHDLANPEHNRTASNTAADIAAYYTNCYCALDQWQAARKRELPGSFTDPLFTRKTAETTGDPKKIPPTVDMGFPAMAAARVKPTLLRAILHDVARYAEAAFGGVALSDSSSMRTKQSYAAAGLGSACRPQWSPETRADDDRELTFGLNEDCDDFVLRTVSIVNALNAYYTAPKTIGGLSMTERGILAALRGQTPLFAFVRAKPPHASSTVGHAVCLMTSGTHGTLVNPWLLECTTSTVPNLWPAPPGTILTPLCRVALPGEYVRLLTTITTSNITYYFTRHPEPDAAGAGAAAAADAYTDGINLESMLCRSGDGSPTLTANELSRTRAAPAGPLKGETIRQSTNWTDLISICRTVLGGKGKRSGSITSNCTSWSTAINGSCALSPLMGWC